MQYREYDGRTLKEKNLQDKLALLRGAEPPTKRPESDFCLMRFQAYTMTIDHYGAPLRVPVHAAPGGFKHGQVYKVLKADVHQAWWVKP